MTCEGVAETVDPKDPTGPHVFICTAKDVEKIYYGKREDVICPYGAECAAKKAVWRNRSENNKAKRKKSGGVKAPTLSDISGAHVAGKGGGR